MTNFDLDYKCKTDERLTLPKIFSLTSLIIAQDNPLLEEEVYEYDLEVYHPQISDLGVTFSEVRYYFENEHILECRECRDFYIKLYSLITNLKDSRKQESFLTLIKNELGLV